MIPFANLTGNEEYDVFSHGLTEELIKSLAAADDIKVVSRTSAFQYKDEPLDIRTVGEELGVGLILEGSVSTSTFRFCAKRAEKLSYTALERASCGMMTSSLSFSPVVMTALPNRVR